MPLGLMSSAYGSPSKEEVPRAGGASTWVGDSPFGGDAALNATTTASRFVPSLSESLLKTPTAALQSSAAATTGMAFGKGTTVPTGNLSVPCGPDLVERSAFLYGLLHSDNLVYDVHDAIAAVSTAAAARAEDGGEDKHVGRRRRLDRIGGGTVLAGVFYFSPQPPWRDMPWRPTYKSVVLLCVFVSPGVCQRAIARLSEPAISARSGGSALRTVLPLSSSPSFTTSSKKYTSRVVLRPASEYMMSPESVDTALLTFLTAPQLAGLLFRRRRMQAPLDRSAANSVGSHSGSESMEDILAYVRANPPSPRVSSSAARLFAAILSPQSTYTVDWAAAQVAVNRGDGVVVPEMEVVEPWVSGWGSSDRSDVPWEHDGRGRSDAVNTGKESDTLKSDSARHPEARLSWKNQAGSLPLTLQEEHYRKQYGVTLQGRNGGGTGIGNNQQEGGEGRGGLLPSRGTLYRGANHLFRGAVWVLKRMRESLGEKESPLMSGPAGLYVPPPLSKRTQSAASSLAGTSALHRERSADEPPLRRTRTEETTRGYTSQRQRNAPMVIPRYNAIGTALSWMPGFHHFGQLFVTSTTVLTPRGATPTREAGHHAHRRRRREEDGDAGDYRENPVWDSLVMQRYADASAAAPQSPRQMPQMHDSVLSWMPPGRGTGWPAASWPPQEKLQRPDASPLFAVGQPAAPSLGATRVAEQPYSSWKGQSGLSGLHAFPASSSAPSALSAVYRAGNSSLLSQSTPAVLPSRGTASTADTASSCSQGPTPRGGIHVERVRSGVMEGRLQRYGGASDNSSFLNRYRHRHSAPKSDGQPTAAAAVVAAPVPLSPAQATRSRPSFAESLRRSTLKSREDAGEASARPTPLGTDRKVVGVAGADASAPSSDTDLGKRPSRRTVSFMLPEADA